MKAGYCEYCGEKIELAPALRGKFQKTALKNINCKDLFEVGEQNNDFDLIKLAAEKGFAYIDLYGAVVDMADIRDRDGMHDNEKGYRLLAQKLAERVYK